MIKYLITIIYKMIYNKINVDFLIKHDYKIRFHCKTHWITGSVFECAYSKSTNTASL